MRYDTRVVPAALAVGFLGGIACATHYGFGFLYAAFFLFVGSCLLFLFTKQKSWRACLLLGFISFAAALGTARVAILPSEAPAWIVSQVGEQVTFEGVVTADPDVRESSARLVLSVEDARVLAVVPLFPEVRFGEKVRVSGVLQKPEAFLTEAGRTFRYDQFLAKDGIFLLVENASLELVAPREGMVTHVRGFLSDVKRKGIDALSVALPEPHAALASGLTLGGKQGLGSELLDTFIIAGLVHIVVLSGYNVMIVAEAVYRLFLLRARRFAAHAAGVIILAFVLVAGAGAASVRAGIMAGIALFGRASGRTYDAFRALVAAALLMLMWNPLLLLYDPGFQLSCIATLGLIFGAPLVERWCVAVRPAFLRSIIASTIAAQIAVLPLLLYQNGLLSLVALPANILILPVVPLTMAVAALAGVAGFVVPSIAPLLALPAYALLSFIIAGAEFFAELPFSALVVPTFPFAGVVGAYFALALFVWRMSRKAYVTHSK